MVDERLLDMGYEGGMASKMTAASKNGYADLLDEGGVVIDESPTISAVFNETDDSYTITTDKVNDGVWVWARTATGVTLTPDEVGGWLGGVLLSSGLQAVGVDSTDIEFEAGGDEGSTYKLHVYQRTVAGDDSNVVSTDYTKNVTVVAGATPTIVGVPVNSTNANTNNLTVTLPATRNVGDWEYLIVGHHDDRIINTPTGFTALTADRFGSSSVLSIKAFAREITAGNVGDTTTSVSASGFGSMNAFAVATTGSGNGAADDSATAPSTDTHTGPTITTTQDNSLVFEAMVARLSAGGTADYVYPLGNALLLVNVQEQATAGATTGTTFITEGNTTVWSPTLAFEVKA